jgi:hypothetical protein
MIRPNLIKMWASIGLFVVLIGKVFNTEMYGALFFRTHVAKTTWDKLASTVSAKTR